jgi:hypothetical protein
MFEEREKLDALGRKIWDSYFSARTELAALTEGADKALYNARSLDFDYPA